MKKVHKIFSSKQFRTITLLLVLNIFLLTAGKEFLHNHEPSNEAHHKDCPVLVINQTLSAGVTIDYLSPNVNVVIIFIFSLPETLLLKTNSPNTYLRAPPVV